ncbi:MAG: DUF1343 domain-containing protein [Spirochaetia bacterium]|nr:DUF1343 domain-containing protein [Spirochaetia bacterium]
MPKVYQNGFSVETKLIYQSHDRERIRIFSLKKGDWPNISENSDPLPGIPERPVYSGLDALAADHFALLRNRKFALLTNATGLDHRLKRGVELMISEGVLPELVFEPEHGIFGAIDKPGPDGIRRDRETGLRILSLYSKSKKPSCKHLEGIDLIVIDIHNLPVRPYTYISTLTYLMEIAEEHRIEVMILDRSNPYGFWKPQGPYLEEKFTGFTAKAPVPFLYSLTPGEYAFYMASSVFLKLRLSIVRAAGYRRKDGFSSLRQIWINPSPNIPSFEAALVYPGVVLFEAVKFSLGRGTTRPFVYSGAPWMKAGRVLEEMRSLKLPGVQFAEVIFTPNSSVYKGKTCRGIQILPVSANFDSLRTGYEYMRVIKKIHPKDFRYIKSRGGFYMDRLWGGTSYRNFIDSDLSYDEFKKSWIHDAASFQELTEPFLLY